MRKFIDYMRSCFCKHNWELIIDTEVKRENTAMSIVVSEKVYRCTKCGAEKRYKSCCKC